MEDRTPRAVSEISCPIAYACSDRGAGAIVNVQVGFIEDTEMGLEHAPPQTRTAEEVIRTMKRTGIFLLLAMLLSGGITIAEEAVVAVVNGTPITANMLEEAIDRLIPRATFHGSVTEEQRAEYRDQALEDVIAFRLQYQDAVARGLKPDRRQIKERLQQVRDSFASVKEYKEWMKGAGVSEAGIKAKLEEVVLVQMVTDVVVNGPSVMNDEALKQYYEQNKEKFRQPETLRLRIISSKSEEKARQALSRIRDGEDFGNVAVRISEDMYRIKGGDIGFIHRGRIYPSLEDAAYKMKAGDTSELIWTEGSWFIVKVEERIPEHVVSFDEAKGKLKRELERKRAQELMSAWMESLKNKAKIEIKLTSSQTATN